LIALKRIETFDPGKLETFGIGDQILDEKLRENFCESVDSDR